MKPVFKVILVVQSALILLLLVLTLFQKTEASKQRVAAEANLMIAMEARKLAEQSRARAEASAAEAIKQEAMASAARAELERCTKKK